MTSSLIAGILVVLLAAMPATRGFAEETNPVRAVQFDETPVPTNRSRSATWRPTPTRPTHSGSTRRRRTRRTPGCSPTPARLHGWHRLRALCRDVRADGCPHLDDADAAPARRTAGASHDRPPVGLGRPGRTTGPGTTSARRLRGPGGGRLHRPERGRQGRLYAVGEADREAVGQPGGQLCGAAGAVRRRPGPGPPDRRYGGALQAPIHPDLPDQPGPK